MQNDSVANIHRELIKLKKYDLFSAKKEGTEVVAEEFCSIVVAVGNKRD